MRKTFFCPDCNQLVPYRVIRRWESYLVHDTTIRIKAKVAICLKCGSDLIAPEIEDKNLAQVYKIYSRMAGLVPARKLTALRKKLNLSPQKLAECLGISVETLLRYEAGALMPKHISDRIKRLMKEVMRC